MTKKLTLDQGGRKGGAVYLDKSVLGPGTVEVNGVGHQLLTGTTLTPEEDSSIAAADLGNHLKDLPHLVAVANDIGDAVFACQLLLQPQVFFVEGLPFQLQSFQVDDPLSQHGGNDR